MKKEDADQLIRCVRECWWRVAILCFLIFGFALVAIFGFPSFELDQVAAAWVQVVVTGVAIYWAGRQGRALFEHQRKARERATVQLAVDVVRALHDHLDRLGSERWWPGERLKSVATGKNHFQIDYLDPIERMLDQVNLEHLSGTQAVEIMVKIRSKIWRIKECLTWVIEDVDEVLRREREGEDELFNNQAGRIKQAVDEIQFFLSELEVHRNRYYLPSIVVP